jgi:DNA-binding PucR family transcriptional regulator
MVRVGWIEDADDLAVERLLLLDESLLTTIVRRELGPLLADPRMGAEFVETLRVYFEAGENMREAARRLHLAPRTVAYRLERIEELLGRPIDGESRARLSVALMAYRALGERSSSA